MLQIFEKTVRRRGYDIQAKGWLLRGREMATPSPAVILENPDNFLKSWGSFLSLDQMNRARLEINHSSAHITRIAERRFLAGLQRGYFFWGEGAAIHTQATIKPCRQPCMQQNLMWDWNINSFRTLYAFKRLSLPEKKSTIFKWGLYNNF